VQQQRGHELSAEGMKRVVDAALSHVGYAYAEREASSTTMPSLPGPHELGLTAMNLTDDPDGTHAQLESKLLLMAHGVRLVRAVLSPR
jgi:hypothetical protein